MKTLALLLCLVSCAAAQTTTRVYQVSKAAGDPDLKEVFAEVAKLEEGKIPASKFEISEKIDASTYVVWKRREQVISNYSDRLSNIGGYTGGRHVPLTREITDPTTPYLLILAAPAEHATGEIIAARCTETAETRQYGGYTLRVLKVTAAKALTKEEFIAMLKDGKTWSLRNFKRKPCFDCGGDGKLTARGKTEKCAPCSGYGSLREDWTVKW